jgi:hypothetical protein
MERCDVAPALSVGVVKEPRIALRRDGAPVAEDPAAYRDRLAELAGILHGIPWMLAGGLTIPVTLGAFYRPHFDVDIAFSIEEFPRIECAMQRAGFQLWTYFPMSLFGACRTSLHVPVRADGRLARWRMRKLKFRDASGRRPVPHLLAIVEALPFRVVDGVLTTCDGRHRLPLDRPLVGHRTTTACGHEIACLDLHYVARLKKSKSEPKHWLDLAVLNDSRYVTSSATPH